MSNLRLAEGEYRFARIVWENEPLPSGRLVELSLKELGWKKSTTYTVLKKLCARGIFQNQDGCVTALISRQDFHAAQSRKFVEDSFAGSLPAFVAAFTKEKALTPEEAAEIRRIIDEA